MAMEAQGYQVEYEGRMYSSLREFAEELNLNYPKVTAYFRKGKSLEEIIEKCQFSTASKTPGPPREGPKRKFVEFNGVQYSSIYAAAEALGISPARVYSVRESQQCSAEAAIEYVLENSTPAGGSDTPSAAKPCVIEGISYPSREAALAAFRLKRITVYSRMKRENIPFEEAVLRGRDSALYRKPAASKLPRLVLIPMEEELKKPEVLADLYRSLSYYNRRVEILMDELSGTPVLFVDGLSYICYNEDARGIEMSTAFDEKAKMSPAAINLFNENNIAVKLFFSRTRGRLMLTAFQSAKSDNQRIEPLLNAWFCYSTIRDERMRKFNPEQVLSVPEKKLPGLPVQGDSADSKIQVLPAASITEKTEGV